MWVKITIVAAAAIFLVSSAKAQTDMSQVLSVCRSAMENEHPLNEIPTDRIIKICATLYDELGKTVAQQRKILADRALSVPQVLIDTCRKRDDGSERSDQEVIACLDLVLHRASETDLKPVHYFEKVKNGNPVRRYWTAMECNQDREPGSVCLSR